MNGIDTNVLLRLLLRDDPVQVARAERCIVAASQDGPVLINPIVLAELTWIMSKRVKLPRSELADILDDLLSADDLSVMFAVPAQRALDAYRNGRADFADYFMAEINIETGCTTTFTFDKKAQTHATFSPVP